MTWHEFLDEFPVLYDIISDLDSQKYDRLQNILGKKFESGVPWQAINDLSTIQKELDGILTKKQELLTKMYEVVMRSLGEDVRD